MSWKSQMSLLKRQEGKVVVWTNLPNVGKIVATFCHLQQQELGLKVELEVLKSKNALQ